MEINVFVFDNDCANDFNYNYDYDYVYNYDYNQQVTKKIEEQQNVIVNATYPKMIQKKLQQFGIKIIIKKYQH